MGSFDYTSEYFIDVSRKCKYNDYMADFYNQMADMEYDKLYPLFERDYDRRCIYQSETYRELNKYRNRAEAIRGCMRSGWTSDYYRFQGVKVVNGVNRCRDRFCYNCQAMDSLQRFHEYAPVIDAFSKDYDIYHCVFTQPNVPGFILKQTMDLMQDSFSRFIRFMNGSKKIRGLDLVEKYGYVGAVRALEVSQNDKDKNYHPHFHCLLVLKKGIDKTPKHRNMFTEDRTHNREDRLFTDFEVFLQRIWYLLMNGIKVTLKNLNDLPQLGTRSYPDGFSCYAEDAHGKYHEVFKYATKGSFKNRSILNDFECFRTLYDALYRRRVYQTYGCFYGIDMNEIHEQVNPSDIADICFQELIEKLNSYETPEVVYESLTDILRITIGEHSVRYLSAQSIRHYFDECPKDKRAELKAKIVACLWDNV
ncbi:MAG: protein rep [Clostridia bacterium]|nr:protein rep [Clostridia bacterium]